MTVTSPTQGLVELTATKTVINTAIRWIGTFLPVLSAAFGASTGTLTSIMGFGELAGLGTSLTGGLNDRGHERRVFMAGLVLVVVSSLVALAGTVVTFAVSFVLLVVGISQATVAAHAWISHRVSFGQRSRSIGIFELSWALALLVGAPIIAGLIELFGWRGAYVALALAAIVSLGVVWLRVPPGASHQHTTGRGKQRLPRSAWPPMLASAAAAHAGIGFFVIAGTWLADIHGLGTTGLGVVAAGYGGVELVSSTTVAVHTDRIGPKRAVGIGLTVLAAAIVALALGGAYLAIAVIGLLAFLGGFEYAFVSSLTLISEAAPEARGRAIGVASALATIARASGVALAGILYERFGLSGPLVMAAAATGISALMLLATELPGSSSPSALRPPRRGVYWARNGQPSRSR